MPTFINRPLNLSNIKAIGFDMDHTIIRYHTKLFEEFTYYATLKELVNKKDYPKVLLDLTFDFDQVIQGLVIDKIRGNVLKLNRFGKVKKAFHGNDEIPFHEMRKIYGNETFGPSGDTVMSLDTNFAISEGVIYSQLVNLKNKHNNFPSFEQIAIDTREMIDHAHRSGIIKSEIIGNKEKYIIKDKLLPRQLEKYKKAKRKLLLITNSEYYYTKEIMDFAINPFLKEHNSWTELFDITVTLSQKPNFFTANNSYLKIDPQTGLMSNYTGVLQDGIFQGGNARKLEDELNLRPDQILYLGDHIFGDVVALKKSFGWRTALVLEALSGETNSLMQAHQFQDQIDNLMDEKELLEEKINQCHNRYLENSNKDEKKSAQKFVEQTEKLNSKLVKLIDQYNKCFNSRWGEIMRAGQEESIFAGQVEKYACVYMDKVSSLLEYSPIAYLRPKKRLLSHEQVIWSKSNKKKICKKD